MSHTIDDLLAFIEQCDDLGTLRQVRLVADKKVKAINASKKAKALSETHRYSKWSLDVAQALWASVQANYPLSNEPNLQQWAEDIDKIERLDKKPRELIIALAKFSQQDDFWRQQVRSGVSLRRHFMKLYVRAKELHDKQQKGRVHVV